MVRFGQCHRAAPCLSYFRCLDCIRRLSPCSQGHHRGCSHTLLFFFSCCAVHHVQRVARELMRMCVSVLVWAPVIVTSFRALLCFHCLSFTRLAPLHLVAVRHSGVWRGHRIVHRIPCCFPVSGLFLSLFFPPLPLFCFKAVLLALLCSVFIGVLHRHAWVPLAKRVVRWGAGNGRTPFSVRFR